MTMLHSAIMRQVLLTVHFIGLAFGLGGTAVADFSFMRAVKMGDRLTPETVNWMRSFSKIVWIGIILLTLSGFGLFFQKPASYLSSPGFLAKMVLVAILLINGLLLNFYTTARLTTFNFSQIYTRRDAAWRARKLSFIFGAISTVTWYATLLIAQFKSVINLSFTQYMLLYLAGLALAITLSLTLEHLLHGRLRSGPLTIDKIANIPRASIPTPPVTVNAPSVTTVGQNVPKPLKPSNPESSRPTVSQPSNQPPPLQ